MTSMLEMTVLSLILRFPGEVLAAEISPTVRDILATAGSVVVSASGEMLLTDVGRRELRAAGLVV